MAKGSKKSTTRQSPRRSPRRSTRHADRDAVQASTTTSSTGKKRTVDQTRSSRSKKGNQDADNNSAAPSSNDEPSPKRSKSSGRRQDTRPASISQDDGNDDITPPAPKGRSKKRAEPSESGNETSGPTSEHTSEEESSSDEEDLTAMKRAMIQRKLVSERVSLEGTHRGDSHHSSSSRSKASNRKATTTPSQSRASSRHRPQVQDADNEESENEGMQPMPEPNGKPPTKRDLNRAREVPHWVSDDKESHSDVPAAIKQNWSKSIALVKNSRGSYSLNMQQNQVKDVCKEAILNFEVELVLHSCFPDVAERLCFGKVAVKAAAANLQKTEILARIEEDPNYCSGIISMPINRLSNIRQDVRDAAEQVLSEYIGGLAEGETVQDRAKAWLNKRNYIWPGDVTKPNGIRPQDPFLNPAVGKVIKAVWYEGTSRKPAIASRFNDRYKCSLDLEECDEKEIPRAMVTAAATAIEATLVDCSNQSSAGKVPRTDFSANNFGEVHTWHCDLLGGIYAKNRRAHHKILSTIYKAVTNKSRSTGFKVEDAMAQIDFDAY